MSTSAERARKHTILARSNILAASALWAAASSLIFLEAVGTRVLGASGFGIVVTWLMGLGTMFMFLPLAGDEDPRTIDLFSRGLRLGDPALDDVLVPVPRRWRSVPWVGTALTSTATTAWTLAIILSIQIGMGVYQIPVDANLNILRLLMANAIWTTTLRMAGRNDARRRAVYELACEGHHSLRGISSPRPGTGPLEPEGHRFTLLDGGAGEFPENPGSGRAAPGA